MFKKFVAEASVASMNVIRRDPKSRSCFGCVNLPIFLTFHDFCLTPCGPRRSTRGATTVPMGRVQRSGLRRDPSERVQHNRASRTHSTARRRSCSSTCCNRRGHRRCRYLPHPSCRNPYGTTDREERCTISDTYFYWHMQDRLGC
jgi:hypothetical protein